MSEFLTPEELVAIPENGGLDVTEEVRDGKKIRSYRIKPDYVLSDTAIVRDNEGSTWLLGYHGGIRYKSKLEKTTFDAIKKGHLTKRYS